MCWSQPSVKGRGSSDVRDTGNRADPPLGDPVTKALVDDLDEGFGQMFAAYRGLVFSAALRLSGRWADAEDLAAEAFLRAYRALRRYDVERIAALEPRAWLMTILLNLWRNDRRANARKPPPGALDEPADVADPRSAVEDAAAQRGTGEALTQLLGRLTDEQRAAVVLRHVLDLPMSEIAAVLGVPQGTAKSHVSRGLRRLRALTDEGALR